MPIWSHLTLSALCWESRAMSPPRPMPSFTPQSHETFHLVGGCDNRISTQYSFRENLAHCDLEFQKMQSSFPWNHGQSNFSQSKICPNENHELSAKSLVLIFKPGECVLKMLRIKIWPIFIDDIEIRINGLNREKAAQSASSSPAHDQIQT